MTSLLEDWCAFCEGRASFDKSHFLGLLKACRDPEAIRQVFRYFPDADEMSRRAWDVISSGTLENALYLLPRKECGLAERLSLGEAWLRELARVCEAFGDEELATICRTAKVVAATRDEVHAARMQDIPEIWVFDRLGDEIRARKTLHTEAAYGLHEALYGLAADYYLAWYIVQPLFDLDIDLARYLRFWRAGGVCALMPTRLLVS